MPQKIFIGNLSGNTEAFDIRVLFEKYGSVSECDVLKNYGFVHMANEQEARMAITELDGTTVKGNRIRVELSTGTSKGGRGGFGGERGRGRGRGGGSGGPMRGRGGGGRGRGSDRYSSDSRPLPPPEYDPYYRRPAPYDYYDRPYADRPRSDDRRPPPPPEDRYLRDRYHPYDRRPPPPDPYDRPYERPRAPPADPYRRPPPDYYSRPRYPQDDPYYPEARYRYDDTYYLEARYAPEERAEAPPSLPPRSSDYYNGYPADYGNGHEPSSTSAQSYYDRFYKTPPARPGYPKAPAKPGQQKDDDQSFLQTEPIFF